MPHLLLSIFLLCLAPFLMGVENLNAEGTARVLEMYVALLGIVLLTPAFLPEQNKEIRELVEAKYTSSITVTIIRTMEAFVFLAVFIGLAIIILKINNCKFSMVPFFLGTLADALFLGGLGLCAYSIFDQIAIAYMLPIMYYVASFGGGKKVLKDFYLFSMIYGDYDPKINLATLGLLLTVIGISFPTILKRIKPLLNRVINKRRIIQD